jgi:capsular exopolysaccharide synthesis family protein
MSRIQDILARAERDGTARRTQASPTLVPPPADFVAPSIDGTSALEPQPFMPEVEPAVFTASAISAPSALNAPLVTGATTTIGTRTAQATLHPALVAAIKPHSPVADQYRAIRARITHEEGASLRTVMVTSPGAGEGKSITAANLALTMAQEFQRQVVLVDGDLRVPSVHKLFGLDGSPGLADLLAGEATLEEALVYLPDFRLTVLPAGRTPQFPTELLGSAAMRRAVDTLRARFDRVLLDLPAVMPLADVGTVAPLADGVVVVVRAGATQRPALDQALHVLEDSKVLGVVLNEVK